MGNNRRIQKSRNLKKVEVAAKIVLIVLLSSITTFIAVNVYNGYDLSIHVMGMYVKNKEQITIYAQNRSVQEIRHTFNHEFGHYIYEAIMNEEERQTWKKINNDTVPQELIGYPSKHYFSEDFANNYANYEEKQPVPRQKYAYIQYITYKYEINR